MMSHGGTNTRLYSTWTNMKSRCYNKNSDRYEWYGAIGIKICDEWLSDFKAFKKWALANGYSDELSIDRFPNGEGNYTPLNCRWCNAQQQAENKRLIMKNNTSGYAGGNDTYVNCSAHNNSLFGYASAQCLSCIAYSNTR